MTKKKRSKKSSKKFLASLTKDVWPQERDFFERPARYKYVRKLLPEKGCVFCNAAKAKLSADSLVLFRNEHIQVLMNKYPYNTGHLLVMPIAHVGNLVDLPDEVNQTLATWLKKSTAILKATMNCQGFNLGLNQGSVAGAGIPDHMHWHIVPRWAGDTNFFPLIGETKVLPETLKQTYSRLKQKFQSEV